MKIVNILISSVALLLIGYYTGYQKASSTKIKKESSQQNLIIKNDNSKEKEILLKQSINNENPIKFKIKIIAASMNEDKIDEKLKNIKDMFGMAGEFTKFTLIDEKEFDTQIGKTRKLLLPNNKFIYFTPKGIDGDSLGLNIRIPWVLNINLHVKTKEGFFQGGLKNGDDFMILYIEPIF